MVERQTAQSVAFQFYRWSAKTNHDLADAIEDRYPGGTLPAGIPTEWTAAQVEDFSKKMTLPAWRKAFNDVGLSQDEIRALADVKKRRNKYVHSPVEARDLSLIDDSPALPEKSEDGVLSQLEQCKELLTAIGAMIDDYLPMDEQVYSRMKSPHD